jgi:hypothetical protein
MISMSNDLNWVKSSYSTATSGNCVEIAALPDGGRAVRDSKNPDGAVLLLAAGQWRRLVKSVLRRKNDKAPGKNPGAFYAADSHQGLVAGAGLARAVRQPSRHHAGEPAW